MKKEITRKIREKERLMLRMWIQTTKGNMTTRAFFEYVGGLYYGEVRDVLDELLHITERGIGE